MAKTIPGGRYLSEDGKTWHDANGRVLTVETPAVPKAKPKPGDVQNVPETLPDDQTPAAQQTGEPADATAAPAVPPEPPEPKAATAKSKKK